MEEGEIMPECAVQPGFLETVAEGRGGYLPGGSGIKKEAWREEAKGVFGSSGSTCSTLVTLPRVGAGGRQEWQAEIRLCSPRNTAK